MSDDEATLRAIECQVLDRQYLKYPILQRNLNEAIAAILYVYGDVVRGLRNGTIRKANDEDRHETANKGFRGLAHSFRWVQARCPRLLTVPSTGEQIHGEALELLRWAVK